jgi:hypothetical protein
MADRTILRCAQHYTPEFKSGGSVGPLGRRILANERGLPGPGAMSVPDTREARCFWNGPISLRLRNPTGQEPGQLEPTLPYLVHCWSQA